MLGGQPNHGWHLCFPHKLHAGWSNLRLNDNSNLKDLLYVHSSFEIILVRKRELVDWLCLSSWCLVVAVWLFLMMPRVCLQFVIVVFPDHTRLLFLFIDEMVGAWCCSRCQAHQGFIVGFDFFCSSIQLYTLLSPYLWFIFFLSWFICTRRWFLDTLEIFHANQSSIKIWYDPHQN